MWTSSDSYSHLDDLLRRFARSLIHQTTGLRNTQRCKLTDVGFVTDRLLRQVSGLIMQEKSRGSGSTPKYSTHLRVAVTISRSARNLVQIHSPVTWGSANRSNAAIVGDLIHNKSNSVLYLLSHEAYPRAWIITSMATTASMVTYEQRSNVLNTVFGRL